MFGFSASNFQKCYQIIRTFFLTVDWNTIHINGYFSCCYDGKYRFLKKAFIRNEFFILSQGKICHHKIIKNCHRSKKMFLPIQKNTINLNKNIWEMKLLKMFFPKLQPSLVIRMLDMMVQGQVNNHTVNVILEYCIVASRSTSWLVTPHVNLVNFQFLTPQVTNAKEEKFSELAEIL